MSGESWVPIDDRIANALASVAMGAPVSDHFITLPSGRTLTIKPGQDAWDAFTPHALAAISEGICPWCEGRMNERRECMGLAPHVHRPTRWHVCALAWGQVFLDVPTDIARTPRSNPCHDCGEEM